MIDSYGWNHDRIHVNPRLFQHSNGEIGGTGSTLTQSKMVEFLRVVLLLPLFRPFPLGLLPLEQTEKEARPIYGFSGGGR